jgi:hypothetical protein
MKNEELKSGVNTAKESCVPAEQGATKKKI